jgi:hypothetical protein
MDVGVQIFPICLDIHAVRTRRSVLPKEPEAPCEVRFIKQARQIAEPMRLVSRCSICYSPQ